MYYAAILCDKFIVSRMCKYICTEHYKKENTCRNANLLLLSFTCTKMVQFFSLFCKTGLRMNNNKQICLNHSCLWFFFINETICRNFFFSIYLFLAFSLFLLITGCYSIPFTCNSLDIDENNAANLQLCQLKCIKRRYFAFNQKVSWSVKELFQLLCSFNFFFKSFHVFKKRVDNSSK